MRRQFFLLLFDWVAICLAAGLLMMLAGGLSRARGEDLSPDYWQAKAATAIAIGGVTLQSRDPIDVHVPATDNEQRTTDNRPIVTFYSASWCVPCAEAKTELKAAAKDLPFAIKIVDVSNGGQPEWCELLPAFAWQHKGQTRYVLGWPGVSQLVRQFEATSKEREKIRSPPANNWPSMAGFVSGRQWPGWPNYESLRLHLKSEHGVTEADQLNGNQLDAVHDLIHRGYTVQQIRNRYSK